MINYITSIVIIIGIFAIICSIIILVMIIFLRKYSIKSNNTEIIESEIDYPGLEELTDRIWKMKQIQKGKALYKSRGKEDNQLKGDTIKYAQEFVILEENKGLSPIAVEKMFLNMAPESAKSVAGLAVNIKGQKKEIIGEKK